MEDRETARMRKYGESKTTRIMMATVPHVTSGLGLRKFQADGFFVDTSVPSLFHKPSWRAKEHLLHSYTYLFPLGVKFNISLKRKKMGKNV